MGGAVWQSFWSARTVLVVEVNGYEIGPGASLAGADLSWANLSWANLEGADLDGADLSVANLEGADLNGADLTEAKADDYTTWPVGFDPVAAGVIFG